MKHIAKWLGLIGLAAALSYVISQGLSLIPSQDHDGRTAAAIVGILAIGALGGLALYFDARDY